MSPLLGECFVVSSPQQNMSTSSIIDEEGIFSFPSQEVLFCALLPKDFIWEPNRHFNLTTLYFLNAYIQKKKMFPEAFLLLL